MKSITIRKVPELVHRHLRVRAAKNGRSLEAELRTVLLRLARAESAASQRPGVKEGKSRSAAPDGVEQPELSLEADLAMKKVRKVLQKNAADVANAA